MVLYHVLSLRITNNHTKVKNTLFPKQKENFTVETQAYTTGFNN